MLKTRASGPDDIHGNVWRNHYAISKDGQRFLLNKQLRSPTTRGPIVVVTNWMATLRK
jgi:hypothetical protein